MALPRISDHQNEGRGHKIPHPASTNFDDSISSPANKRLKRHESTDSSLSRKSSEDEDLGYLSPPKHVPREIVDSEEDSDGDDVPLSQTELESSLPSISADKKAIDEYEALGKTKQAPAGFLQESPSSYGPVYRKSSIYVDAFNLALETVLEEERHLFDESEIAIFEHWRSLSYEGQYLYGVVSSRGAHTH